MTHRLLILTCTVLLMSACLQGAPGGTLDDPASSLDEVVLGLGFIPSVQFAPYYVALDQGFYRDAGLDVRFEHGSETDFLQLMAADQMEFVVASGEQVILSRAQGVPVTYVMQWFSKFPVVLFAPQELGLTHPPVVEEHVVGIPGLYGASLIAWKALVYAGGIDEQRVQLESIGFTQAEAVSQGRVDAAIDYAVNGPVRLAHEGQAVDVIYVSDYIDLPSNGIVTSERRIQEQPDQVRAMVQATIKGIEFTLNHPDEAFAIALEYVPEAGGGQEAINRAVFDGSLEFWQARPGLPLGATKAEVWEDAIEFMRAMELLQTDVPLDGLFTNEFLEP